MKKLYFLFVLFVSSISMAQIPQGFSYQAMALNASGNPVSSAPVKIRLSILDNSAAGTPVYVETHNPTTNAQGLFTLIIGQGTATTGTFSAISWATNPKFLKVEIDVANGSAFVTVGTSQLLAVPYAMMAGGITSDSGSGESVTVSLDNGALGLLTSSSAYAFAPYASGGTSSSNNQWFSQPLSGTPLGIMGSQNVIGVLTSSTAYAFGPYATGGTTSSSNQWFSKTLSGTPVKIVGTRGIIGVATSSAVYAFGPYSSGGTTNSNNQWFSQTISGTIIDIVSSEGIIGVLTTTNAYAFAPYASGGTTSSNNQWFSQSLSGTGLKIVAKGGKILVQTSTTAYAFGPYASGGTTSSNNQWFSQTLSGSPIGVAE